MPSARLAGVANELFDIAHGGAVLDAMEIKWYRDRSRAYFEDLALQGDPNATWLARSAELRDPVFVQQFDVLLSYASDRLASVVDFGEAHDGGNHGSLFFRAITFDLAQREMFYLTACPGSPSRYGLYSKPQPNLLFQFGPLLRICDQARYEAFKSIYARHARLTFERALRDRVDWGQGCAEDALKDEDIAQQEVLVYLTFTGLAVQRMSFEAGSQIAKTSCPSRSSANPTIVPYRDLAPLMEPGPWRDELLALR